MWMRSVNTPNSRNAGTELQFCYQSMAARHRSAGLFPCRKCVCHVAGAKSASSRGLRRRSARSSSFRQGRCIPSVVKPLLWIRHSPARVFIIQLELMMMQYPLESPLRHSSPFCAKRSGIVARSALPKKSGGRPHRHWASADDHPCRDFDKGTTRPLGSHDNQCSAPISWRRRNRSSASNDLRGRRNSPNQRIRSEISRTTMENALSAP